MAASRPQARKSIGARKKRAAHDPLPDFVTPCLAKLADAPPEGDDWVHEVKYDGYRLQARIEGSDIRLMTRSGQDWTDRFPSVAQALSKLRLHSALLDGEVVVEDERGHSSFVALVGALKSRRSDRMVLYVFDALYLAGADIRTQALEERKRRLKAALARAGVGGRIRFSEHFDGSGRELLAAASAHGLEGIISKRRDQPYRSGRQRDWLKSKCVESDEFVIGGFIPSTADARSVGSLALGYFERGAFIYAGRVGTGFTATSGRTLWKLLETALAPRSQFQRQLTAAERRGVRWVDPKFVVQVAYRGFTDGGLLRHAVFIGLREDKLAGRVRHPKRR